MMAADVGNRVGLQLIAGTVAADMEAFDQLPPPVRAAMRDCPLNVAAGPFLDFWHDGQGDCMDRFAGMLEALAAVA